MGVADAVGVVDNGTGEGCDVFGGFNVGFVTLTSVGVTNDGFIFEHPLIAKITIASINLRI